MDGADRRQIARAAGLIAEATGQRFNWWGKAGCADPDSSRWRKDDLSTKASAFVRLNRAAMLSRRTSREKSRKYDRRRRPFLNLAPTQQSHIAAQLARNRIPLSACSNSSFQTYAQATCRVAGRLNKHGPPFASTLDGWLQMDL